MDEVFVTYQEAAELSGLTYTGFVSKVSRDKKRFVRKKISRENGGKPLVLIALTSLSYEAQKKYKAAHPEKFSIDVAAAGNDDLTADRPWYIDQDYQMFIHQHRQEWENAQTIIDAIDSYFECKQSVQSLVATGRSLTDYVNELAAGIGIKSSTFYKKADELAIARKWDKDLTAVTGVSHIYFERMAFCRKPLEKNTFPSMTEEIKTLARCVFWNDNLAQNNAETGGLIYQIFTEKASESGLAPIPSVDTFKRYIQYLRDNKGGEQAHALAKDGLREFRRTTTMKARRSTKELLAMEYVETDGHTFDLFVSVVGKNGKLMAIRPKIIAFIDVKTRMILGDTICIQPDAQVIKKAACKMIYGKPGGLPKHMRMDNGKELVYSRKKYRAKQERAHM